LAPLDTWAIFVEKDAVHLGQRMVKILGQEMMEIDKNSVTKAPVIFTVQPTEWTSTLKDKVISTAQAIIFIIPAEMKALLQVSIHELQIPYAIVSQDKLNKMGKRELD
jgi:hypothetical protein